MSKADLYYFVCCPKLIDDTPLDGDYRQSSEAPLHGKCSGIYLHNLGWYDLRGNAGCVCKILKPNYTRKKNN
jgi:hypothetical protein